MQKTSPSTLMGCHLSHREGVLITHTPYGGAGTAISRDREGIMNRAGYIASGHNAPIPLITTSFYQRALGMSIYDNDNYRGFSVISLYFFHKLLVKAQRTTIYCGAFTKKVV